MPRRPGVYLFDEFDSIAKARGDGHDVGEMNRIVTSFLQLTDSDKSNSILIAATNHAELLDRAIFRRFDLIVPFAVPSANQIETLLRIRFKAFDLPTSLLKKLSRAAKGMSFADIDRACDDAIRTMALSGRGDLEVSDVEDAFSCTEQRRPKKRSKV
jgi:SpoVK/Ycf46/Vps4 family AAA+-type ATPase